MEARAGEQTGVVTKACRNSAPSANMRSMLGVLISLLSYAPCAHYEFPLGGAGTGKRELTGMTRAEVFRILRRNLRHLRDLISDSGLA